LLDQAIARTSSISESGSTILRSNRSATLGRLGTALLLSLVVIPIVQLTSRAPESPIWAASSISVVCGALILNWFLARRWTRPARKLLLQYRNSDPGSVSSIAVYGTPTVNDGVGVLLAGAGGLEYIDTTSNTPTRRWQWASVMAVEIDKQDRWPPETIAIIAVHGTTTILSPVRDNGVSKMPEQEIQALVKRINQKLRESRTS